MSRKPKQPTFEQVLDTLRARSFEVTALADGQFRVSKYGCGAVLAAGITTPAAEVETARFAIGGELGDFLQARGFAKGADKAAALFGGLAKCGHFAQDHGPGVKAGKEQ